MLAFQIGYLLPEEIIQTMRYKTKANRLNSNWGPSYLYLRKHAEEQAIKQFGSLRALDEEKGRRSRKKFHRTSHPSELLYNDTSSTSSSRIVRRVTMDQRTSSPLSSCTETDRFLSSSSSAKALKRRWNASTKTISSLNHCKREPDLLIPRRNSPRTSSSSSSPLRSDADADRSRSVRSSQLLDADVAQVLLQGKVHAEQAEEVKILSELVRENTALIRSIYRKLVIAIGGIIIFLFLYLLLFTSDNNAMILQRFSHWLQKRALVGLQGCMAGVSLYIDAFYASIYYFTRDLYAYVLRHPLNSFYKTLMP